MKISPSSMRTMSTPASTKALRKPSSISMSTIAKAMPLAERTSLLLSMVRMRQASGTSRVVLAICRSTSALEQVDRIGAPHAAHRDERRARRHGQRDQEHRGEARAGHRDRQVCRAAHNIIDEERASHGKYIGDRSQDQGKDHDDLAEIAV